MGTVRQETAKDGINGRIAGSRLCFETLCPLKATGCNYQFHKKKFEVKLNLQVLGKKSNSKLPLKGHGQNKMDVLCFVSYKFSNLHTET